MKYFRFSVVLFSVLVTTQYAAAQISSGAPGGNNDAFLKGQYLQLGISNCGAYGSRYTPAPMPAGYCSACSGYYFNSPDNNLSFINDAGRNGWTVAGPSLLPNYSGDFLLGNEPDEGWCIQIGPEADSTTKYYYGYSGDSVASGVSGSFAGPLIKGNFSAYFSSGFEHRVKWTSDTFGGLKIRQTTSLIDTANCFITSVLVRNTSPVTVSSIYYTRALNPDNSLLNPGGSAVTTNMIVAKRDTLECYELLQALATNGSYIALGTADSRSSCCIGGTAINDLSPEAAWAGTGITVPPLLTAVGATATADEMLRMSFKFDSIRSGDSVLFRYVTFLNPGFTVEFLDYTQYDNSACDTFFAYASVCPGDTVLYNGNIYTWPGDYVDSILWPSGFIQPVSLHIYAVPLPVHISSVNICDGDTVYSGTHFYTTTGTYYDTIVISGNCDSVARLNLYVTVTTYDTLSHHLCSGEEVIIGGDLISTDTFLPYDTTYNLLGCIERIRYMHVYTTDTAHTVIYNSLCLGETFNWGSIPLSTAGIYYQTFHTTAGCDSNVVLHLVVNPPDTFIAYGGVCDGGVYHFRGQVLSHAGTYYDSTVTLTHCIDSFFVFHFNVYSPYILHSSDTICPGDSTWFDGYYISNDGFYIDSTTSVYGCDSTHILQLIHRPVLTEYVMDTICQGSVYDFFGTTYSAEGIYAHSATSVHGCDSSVFLFLSVNTPDVLHDTFNLCWYDSLVFNTHVYHSAGIYYDTLYTAGADCPHLIDVLHISKYPAFTAAVAAAGDTLFCLNDTADHVAWFSCPDLPGNESDTNFFFVPDTTGYYAAVVLKNACYDTSACFFVFIDTVTGLHSITQQQLNVFPNPFESTLLIHCSDYWVDAQAELYSTDGKRILNFELRSTTSVDTQFLEPGLYILNVKSSSGENQMLRVLKQ